MNTIQLNATDRAARGRNGWFRPATIEVSTSDLANGRGVIVAVNSRARAGFPPIYFELAPEHARQLATAILQQTEGDLVAQVQAADTQIAALLGGREMVSLTVHDETRSIEMATLQRLAAFARQILGLAVADESVPAPAAPAAMTRQALVEVEWHPDYRGGDWDDMGELTLLAVEVGPAGLTDAVVAAAFQAQLQHDPICIIRWQDASNDPA